MPFGELLHAVLARGATGFREPRIAIRGYLRCNRGFSALRFLDVSSASVAPRKEASG
jgi:hypothetical protein